MNHLQIKYGIKVRSSDVYFFGLCLLAASIPLSKVGMSIAQILLVGNWLMEWQIPAKFKNFFRNRTALILCSLYILHIIGLLYTVDFDYALKDLKVKLPMLILPLIIATSELLSYKKFRTLIIVFSLGLFASTLHAFYHYITHNYQDIRDICVFISHLRISLLICISIFFLLKFILSDKELRRKWKYAFALLILWFVYFLFILKSFTGPLLIIVCFSALSIINLSRIKKILVKVALVSAIVLVPVIIFVYILHTYNKYFSHTRKENPIQDIAGMQKVWDNRSKISFDGTDLDGDSIKYTIISFLNSKEQSKDSASIAVLSTEEIKAIEDGINDVYLVHMHSLQARIYETLWEYKYYTITGNPTGYSLMMRLEYWKASLGIIKDNLLFGVGTGDVNNAFVEQYNKMNSPLSLRWRLKAHNQFLTFGVAFGIIGILWFIIVLFYPLFIRKFRTDFYYQIFFIILFCSMLTEDTIESQAGLTIYVFFNTLLLLGRKDITE